MSRKTRRAVTREIPAPIYEACLAKMQAGSAEECWRWAGAHDAGQRPLVYIPGRHTMRSALRVIYHIYYRRIPNDWVVQHTCEHAWCVNPNHCYITTRSDASRTQKQALLRRGRHQVYRGEANQAATLTADQVRDLRHLAETTDLSYREIGERFGVDKATAWRVVQRKTWTHL